MPPRPAVESHADEMTREQVRTMRTVFGAPDQDTGVEDPQCLITNARIAIVDDQELNVRIVVKHLKLAGYQYFFSTTDSREALALLHKHAPDVLLLDIMMPFIGGLDILREIREDEQLKHLPVIILTADCEPQTKLEALTRGATEFLQKPVDAAELCVRLSSVLLAKTSQDRLRKRAWDLEVEVARRNVELAEAHREVVECLARIGEFRDNDTGLHTQRVGRYAEITAVQMGLPPEFCERLRLAAALHDIGKVSIPDAILRKPGPLDRDEFAVIQRHSAHGAAVCLNPRGSLPTEVEEHCRKGQCLAKAACSPMLTMAGVIALTHHERWDGTGYPSGLKGEEIPLEGRITAVADVFDALSQRRPYKPAFSFEKSMSMIHDSAGTHFAPQVVDAFERATAEIFAVWQTFRDRPEADAED